MTNNQHFPSNGVSGQGSLPESSHDMEQPLSEDGNTLQSNLSMNQIIHQHPVLMTPKQKSKKKVKRMTMKEIESRRRREIVSKRPHRSLSPCIGPKQLVPTDECLCPGIFSSDFFSSSNPMNGFGTADLEISYGHVVSLAMTILSNILSVEVRIY